MAEIEAVRQGAEAELDKDQETTGNQDAETIEEHPEEEPSSSTGAYG